MNSGMGYGDFYLRTLDISGHEHLHLRSGTFKGHTVIYFTSCIHTTAAQLTSYKPLNIDHKRQLHSSLLISLPLIPLTYLYLYNSRVTTCISITTQTMSAEFPVHPIGRFYGESKPVKRPKVCTDTDMPSRLIDDGRCALMRWASALEHIHLCLIYLRRRTE